MAGINTGRVLVGGLVAGLIINVSESIFNMPVAGAQMEAALAKFSLPPVGGGAITYFVLWSFVTGVLLVWLYAAMRPRLGPGPKTAVVASLLVWFLAYFSSGTSMVAMGFMPIGLSAFAIVWGLVELIVAGYVGAMLYKEA